MTKLLTRSTRVATINDAFRHTCRTLAGDELHLCSELRAGADEFLHDVLVVLVSTKDFADDAHSHGRLTFAWGAVDWKIEWYRAGSNFSTIVTNPLYPHIERQLWLSIADDV